MLFLVVLACGSAGCTVATTVSVSEPSPGQGTVGVSVLLDRSALESMGGLTAFRSQLSVGDLRSAGWSVTGPSGTPDGGAVVSASHPFSNPLEAARLLSDVAGEKAFRLTLSSRHTFWHTYYQLAGTVDLTCGLGCFGDSGLRSATGSPLGVDPAPLQAASGQQPASVFKFSLQTRLPGRVEAAGNAARRPDGTLEWAPALGRVVAVSASSSALNEGAVAGVAGGGGALILVVLVTALWLMLRRRRRRPVGRHGRGRDAAAGGGGEAVAEAGRGDGEGTGAPPGEPGPPGPPGPSAAPDPGEQPPTGGETVTPPS